ncbi:hypothetical protein [Bdellovibrio svalbardensis]|uniref:Uncharacterized protein n=1 Tax=Bdellovibrio svalbardensis TaxID=2972972 RepID=A0ABT6DI00_9BACT|nr:hypothetical protein [Bdellovibrio svalbardensis]MDG0816479.1 hypothetical protein [Bdellovibrio svalbardensis]
MKSLLVLSLLFFAVSANASPTNNFFAKCSLNLRLKNTDALELRYNGLNHIKVNMIKIDDFRYELNFEVPLDADETGVSFRIIQNQKAVLWMSSKPAPYLDAPVFNNGTENVWTIYSEISSIEGDTFYTYSPVTTADIANSLPAAFKLPSAGVNYATLACYHD